MLIKIPAHSETHSEIGGYSQFWFRTKFKLVSQRQSFTSFTPERIDPRSIEFGCTFYKTLTRSTNAAAGNEDNTSRLADIHALCMH
jgi:hypothetical protein